LREQNSLLYIVAFAKEKRIESLLDTVSVDEYCRKKPCIPHLEVPGYPAKEKNKLYGQGSYLEALTSHKDVIGP
jgi:hypothetical protein